MYKGWIKYFKDGTSEPGFDNLINENKASWSKGRLKDINVVSLKGNNYNCALEVPNTEWHQFDRFLNIMGSNQSLRILRVIQAKITKDHIGMYFCSNNTESNNNYYYLSKEITGSCFQITEELVDQWITFIGNEKTGKFSFVVVNKGQV